MKGYLDAVVPLTPHIEPYVPFLRAGMFRYDIVSPLRGAHFLAQMAVESSAFSVIVENLNYREDKLVPLFGSHRISVADAKKFGRSINGRRPAHQNALANILYGGAWGLKHLGNTKPGDGWRFRGRGLKQITGRANYARISQELYGDDRLVVTPDLLLQPEAAALSACAYWHLSNLNPVADRDDIVAITRKVNGGINGLEGTGGRRWWLAKFKALFHEHGIL